MQPFWNTKYQANHLKINFKKVLYPRIVIFYTATENIATVLENPIPGTHTNSRSLEFRGEQWSKSSFLADKVEKAAESNRGWDKYDIYIISRLSQFKLI